jgi:hypothetical protein
MPIEKTFGKLPERAGFLIPEDRDGEVKLPSSVMDRTFQRGLWSQINSECGTDIDEYEGVWLESSDLTKAADLIRLNLKEDEDAPDFYVECLRAAAEMLDQNAARGVRVMFSL